MITTEFVPGSPCWLDLGAPDPRAAAAFYGSVFGWQYDPITADDGAEPQVEEGTYGLLRSEGDVVGMIGPLTEEGARSAWMVYFRTDDVEATTRAVEQAGGAVRVRPMDAGGWARIAQYTDPVGGQFAAWQPGRSPGLEAVDRPGALNWVELYTTDATRARAFYREVFGWRYDDTELPGGVGTYSMITPAGQPIERMHGGLLQMPADALALNGGRPYWHPVFAVADCDAAVAAATSGGGTVQMGPDNTPGVGRLAVCIDPSGADFVTLTPEVRAA